MPIHPSALISDDAELAADVEVGPFAIIDGPAIIGPGCKIGPHVWINGRVTMGADNTIGCGSILGSYPQDLSFDPTGGESGVVLGDGNTLREYVTINRGNVGAFTTVGDNNFFMIGVHLAHDVQVANDNIFANNTLLAGHVSVGTRVFIGGGAAFHQFIHIGDHAMVAGLASITRDVPPFCMTTRDDTLAGLNVVGLRRAGVKPAGRSELKEVYRILFQRRGTLAEALTEARTREWSEFPTQLIDAVANPNRRGILSR